MFPNHPQHPPVKEVELEDKEFESTWYPDSWMSKCQTDKIKLGIMVLSPVTLPFWGQDGKKYIKFPAWHKETGSLVYVLAPALNHSEDSILRDCPQLTRYRPMIPEDIPGAQQIVPATDLRVEGVLLQPPSARYHEMNLGYSGCSGHPS